MNRRDVLKCFSLLPFFRWPAVASGDRGTHAQISGICNSRRQVKSILWIPYTDQTYLSYSTLRYEERIPVKNGCGVSVVRYGWVICAGTEMGDLRQICHVESGPNGPILIGLGCREDEVDQQDKVLTLAYGREAFTGLTKAGIIQE